MTMSSLIWPMIWVNSATQTYSIYGSILCKLNVSNLWRVQVIFIYLFFCICNKLLSHNGWGQSYLRWQFLRFLWESSLIMWKKVHSIYTYIQKYFVLTASFTLAWKFQVSVRCLKGLALKINEKYMKRWHLWCGKFAEKTQIAWFCLNESKRSNSFQIKGEKVKRERESECLTTEFGSCTRALWNQRILSSICYRLSLFTLFFTSGKSCGHALKEFA